MSMHNPPHPGELLHENIVEALELSITEAARRLGMTRPALSRVMNGHAAVSPELAYRLELAGMGTARHWLAMQTAYELWHVQHRPAPRVERLVATA